MFELRGGDEYLQCRVQWATPNRQAVARHYLLVQLKVQNPDVIRCADWIIDLGPDGGD